jgi:alpha-tubulin suppressor-like RCC1 family protein
VVRHIWLATLVAAVASAAPANPPRLSYATYVGAPSGSVVYGLAVDSAGNAYVSGMFPCGFLTKLNQTGTAAIWSVCLPMTEIHAVAVDAAGYIYVAGNNQTQQYASLSTSTIMKLSPDAQQTVYSTSISGAYAVRMVVDRAGNAYITGLASSNFKATPGAYLTVSPRLIRVRLPLS